MEIPPSIKEEHEERHLELSTITREGGETGKIAKEITRLMHPHFVKEERFALPPLSLLPLIARDEEIPDLDEALELIKKFKAELPAMLEEHKTITQYLKRLIEAAKKEGKAEAITFAMKLLLHVQAEEEVFYPASILAGKYIEDIRRK